MEKEALNYKHTFTPILQQNLRFTTFNKHTFFKIKHSAKHQLLKQ